jgi:hypothetical protein
MRFCATQAADNTCFGAWDLVAFTDATVAGFAGKIFADGADLKGIVDLYQQPTFTV